MSNISDILDAAHRYAQEHSLPYAGSLFPADAYALLMAAPGTILIDVRTRAECDWVGRIPGAVEIEWATYPCMQRNPNFVAQLESAVDREALVLFLCRSGHRSHMAAAFATECGYSNCYNILEGFEGDKDSTAHCRCVNGWIASGLPWQQG